MAQKPRILQYKSKEVFRTCVWKDDQAYEIINIFLPHLTELMKKEPEKEVVRIFKEIYPIKEDDYIMQSHKGLRIYSKKELEKYYVNASLIIG